MNYPLISEYIESIKAAEDNFAELKTLCPIYNSDGFPVMSGGNFAVVFKMKDEQTGRLHAVKCFLKEQEDRGEAYRMIAEELEYVNSTFLTPIKYLDKELFVDTKASDETEFPVLLMDWVEGQTLDKYIREHIKDQYELSLLAYQFSRLAMWLMSQPFAHGDLKPDNIIVKEDGTLVLVDYDGMFVPAMKGQRARELGSPDFRHPSRTEDNFDEHIDDFSLVSILLSLKAIALQPELLEQYGAKDRLLFSERDYRNLSESQVMDAIKTIMQDAELATLYSLFILSSAQNNLSQASFRLLNLSRPQYSSKNKLSNERKGIDLEYVDLGLSVKWATCNLGAKQPEEYGDYFKWGDDIPKNSPSSSKKSHLSYNSKYNASDRNKILDPEDDTATILLGCPWRMPTIEEFQELKEKCVWKEDYLNGVKGCRVTGPNGNSIFLPFAGSYDVGFPFNKGCGVYWSSTAFVENNFTFNNSWYLSLKKERPTINYYDRSSACSIRPVMLEDENLSTEVTDGDLANAWIDEFGVMYSLDRRRLLRGSKELWEKDIWEYEIIDGTKVICDSAFYLFEHLYHNGKSSINIPNSVIKIGNAAFKGLSLSSIVIPDSVKEIVGNPFVCNKGLASIKVHPNNMFYDSRNNCNAIIETQNNTLIAGCTNSHIPDNVEKIGDSAFRECLDLTNVVLPNSVLMIGNNSFEGCQSLKTMSIPNHVKSIGDKAFAYCEFDFISLPDGVKHFGKNLFEGSRLKRIYSSERIKSIILQNNPDYKHYFDETISTSLDFTNAWIDEVGAKYSANKNKLLAVPKDTIEYSVKDGTEVICNYSFTGGSRNILFAMLGTYAKAVGIKIISLPDSIKEIGKHALIGCSSLDSIIIPVGTKMKFEGLLPEYKDKLVESDDSETISTLVTEEDLANAWTDELGVKYSSDRKRLLKAPSDLKEYRIIEGTKVICNGYAEFFNWGRKVKAAFCDCESLESIEIPKSVVKIGDSAFAGCNSLKQIIIPDSITTIGNSAFSWCYSLAQIRIPDSVSEIGENAFFTCSALKQVTIPRSIISLRKGIFYGCNSLQEIIIPDTVINIEDSAIEGCTELKQIVIPNSVRHIGNRAFKSCKSLCQIGLPMSISKISDEMFSNCTSLEKIVIPYSISDIGQFAFYECISLGSISIPNTVVKIGKGAFSTRSPKPIQIYIPMGTKSKFEALLPFDSNKLIELEK